VEFTRRNAVRSEAKLPLLDIHAEFVQAVEVAGEKHACSMPTVWPASNWMCSLKCERVAEFHFHNRLAVTG
jgi:hypothetical protein